MFYTQLRNYSRTYLVVSLLLIVFGFESQLFAQVNSKTSNVEIKLMKNNLKGLLLNENKEDLIDLLSALPKETILADQIAIEVTQRYPQKDEEIAHLLNGLGFDGSWKDIKYDGVKKSGWEPMEHADRILSLAKVYSTKTSKYYQSKQIANAMHLTLDYWFRMKLVSKNWWYNEIGVPKILGGVFILFEDELTQSEKQEAIKVMNNSSFKMTGQNKVWQSGNVLMRGLLQNDINLVKQARDTILSEIIVEHESYGKIEGIREDKSFHQHGEQQQFGNYGAAYVSSMSFWCKVFYGTSISAGQKELDILSGLINDGFHRILWKGKMDVNCLGRQFFKQSMSHKAFSLVFSASIMSEIDSKNRAKYYKLVNDNIKTEQTDKHLNGLYHFWKSDQTVFRTSKWMASIRMSSPGTIGGEGGNGDNLKGYYMSDGATYMYVDGNEYADIFPVWDWRKLPGVTAYESKAPLKVLNFGGYWNQNKFVGNINDGKSGLTTFQLQRDGLNALKSWVITKDFVLCIGAGIQTNNDSIVTTSIEQRISKGDLLLLKNRQWIPTENITIDNPKDMRFYIDKSGYIVIHAEKLVASNQLRSGSWNEIMQTYPSSMKESKQVSALWLNHGKNPLNSVYQYILLPACSKSAVANFDLSTVKVLMNASECQVVYLPKDKKVYIAATQSIKLTLPNDVKFKCDNPGLFLIDQFNSDKMSVNAVDPTEELLNLNVEINGKTKQFNFKRQ